MESVRCSLSNSLSEDPVRLGMADSAETPDERYVFDRASLTKYLDRSIHDGWVQHPVDSTWIAEADIFIHEPCAEVIRVSHGCCFSRCHRRIRGPYPTVTGPSDTVP